MHMQEHYAEYYAAGTGIEKQLLYLYAGRLVAISQCFGGKFSRDSDERGDLTSCVSTFFGRGAPRSSNVCPMAYSLRVHLIRCSFRWSPDLTSMAD